MDEGLQKKLQNVADWLISEYSGIRTGQAAPGLLDSVKVESFGAIVSLNQIGSVSIENARTLRISLWDQGSANALEKAIIEADLGVSVVTDSSGLRVIFPELTSERRVQLNKLAGTKLEDARVRVRSVRDEAMKQIDADEKSGEIGKDERFVRKEAVQKQIDEINKKLESLFDKKEVEINS